jgi:late competence protein required for DNA uptake (superfamily II DNA/RNA helicase)
MFRCERCGSGYNANHVGVENCPRCMLVDRVQAPLSFKMFKIADTAEATQSEPRPEPEEAQRVRSAR